MSTAEREGPTTSPSRPRAPDPTPAPMRAPTPAPMRAPTPSPAPRPRAIAAGHICLDFITGLGNRPLDLRPGELRIVDSLTVSTGGPVSNAGIVLHRLGVPTRLVALVGDDPLAGLLRSVLDAESPGLSDGLVTRPGEATSYTVILSSATTDRIFLHLPGANDAFGADDLTDDTLDGAELLHVGYPPLMRRLCENDGRELETMLRRARLKGLVTSLDMAEPDRRIGEVNWPALLARVLPWVDVFCPSLGELGAMLGGAAGGGEPGTASDQVRPWDGAAPPDEGAVRRLAATALDLGAGMVALKVGAFGLYLRTGPTDRMAAMAERLPALPLPDWSNRELWCPIYQVPVRGTTGSGDATIAGFLTALLDRWDPVRALDFACAVGSLCVEAEDAVSGIRSRADAEARMSSGLPRPMPSLSERWTHVEGSAVMERR